MAPWPSIAGNGRDLSNLWLLNWGLFWVVRWLPRALKSSLILLDLMVVWSLPSYTTGLIPILLATSLELFLTLICLDEVDSSFGLRGRLSEIIDLMSIWGRTGPPEMCERASLRMSDCLAPPPLKRGVSSSYCRLTFLSFFLRCLYLSSYSMHFYLYWLTWFIRSLFSSSNFATLR